ncbi:hypothetical protein AYJ22_16085 [Ferroacidibacillus organovorans]|nr:hypothetical protein AYJ22_16085 [Ferroacidibacillus organovorans]
MSLFVYLKLQLVTYFRSIGLRITGQTEIFSCLASGAVARNEKGPHVRIYIRHFSEESLCKQETKGRVSFWYGFFHLSILDGT